MKADILEKTFTRVTTGSKNATNCFSNEHTPHAYTPHMPAPLTTYVTPGAPSKLRKSLTREIINANSVGNSTMTSADNDMQKKLDHVVAAADLEVGLPPHNLGNRTRQRLVPQAYQDDCSMFNVLTAR